MLTFEVDLDPASETHPPAKLVGWIQDRRFAAGSQIPRQQHNRSLDLNPRTPRRQIQIRQSCWRTQGGGRKNPLHPVRLRSVADEDVDASNWDDAASDDVVVSRHDGAVAVDVDGDGFADAAKCSRLERDA